MTDKLDENGPNQAGMNGDHRQLNSDSEEEEQEKLTESDHLGAASAQVMLGKPFQPTLHWRRWFMLGMFCCYSFSNAYQWIHLNIIYERVKEMWNASMPGDEYQRQLAVDWLSMVYMLAYIPLIFPATWLLEKRGLRLCSILATLLNALGAWLKCAAVSWDGERFWLVMVAQTTCAVAQVFILGIPAHLAAVWFGENEVSTATAIGVFGNQLGVAVGFALPPMIVSTNATAPNREDLIHGFRVMFFSGAVVMTVLFLLVLIFFRARPPTPPSPGQLALAHNDRGQYQTSLNRLSTHIGFILLTLSYGINTGCYYAVGTLLSLILGAYFPSQEANIGWAGFTMVVAGIFGAIVAGVILDATKKFKLIVFIIYFLSMASMAVFTGCLYLESMPVVFVIMFLLGFFMTGYLPLGFEFAAEITYPENEGLSSGLLNACAQLFGIVLTLSTSVLITKHGAFAGNTVLSSLLLIGTIITAVTKEDLRRQRAHKQIIEINYSPTES